MTYTDVSKMSVAELIGWASFYEIEHEEQKKSMERIK